MYLIDDASEYEHRLQKHTLYMSEYNQVWFKKLCILLRQAWGFFECQVLGVFIPLKTLIETRQWWLFLFRYSYRRLSSQRGRFKCTLSFKDTFHRLHHVLENDPEVWAIAVWCIFGFLAGTQHERLVFLRREAQRSNAGSVFPVCSVTEGLREREQQ